MNKLVYFQDTFDNEPQYGIMLDNENILCLCCGGIVEKGEYEILEWCEWFNFSLVYKSIPKSPPELQRV